MKPRWQRDGDAAQKALAELRSLGHGWLGGNTSGRLTEWPAVALDPKDTEALARQIEILENAVPGLRDQAQTMTERCSSQQRLISTLEKSLETAATQITQREAAATRVSSEQVRTRVLIARLRDDLRFAREDAETASELAEHYEALVHNYRALHVAAARAARRRGRIIAILAAGLIVTPAITFALSRGYYGSMGFWTVFGAICSTVAVGGPFCVWMLRRGDLID